MANESFKTHVRNWRNWIILILLIAVVWLLMRGKPNSDMVIKMHQDSIAVLSKKVDSLQVMDMFKTKSLQALGAKQNETALIYDRKQDHLTKELRRARGTIQEMIDSIPVLKAYVDLSDSLHELRVERIHTLGRELEFKSNLYDDLIEIKDAKFRVSGVIIDHKDGIIQQQGKTIRKQGRLIKVLKVFIPVALIGGAVAGETLN